MQIRDTRNGSWYWVNVAVNSCPHISHADKSVYGALCSFAGCEEIRPDFEIIATRSCTSLRQAKMSVSKLVKAGYVEITKGGGRGRANVYVLLKCPKGCISCTFSKGCKIEQERVQKTAVKGAKSAPQLDKELDKNKITVADATEPFSFEEELKKLKDSTRKDFKIIALYWKIKNYRFDNHSQFSKGLRRELKPAGMLTGYSGTQIAVAINYCRDEYNEKIPWTLETVGKRIADLVNVK